MTTDMVTAHQTQSDDATKMKSLGRIGAVSAVAGAVVLLIATLVHPFESDPNIDRLAFAEYAADSLWVWSHLGQFLGVAILGVALVALAGTLTSGRARPWAYIGVAGAAASVALAAALQAVDGVALKVMVDRWAAATGEARVLAFEAAFAVRQIEIGMASLLNLVLGFTLMIFGVAIFYGIRYPNWLGAIGLLGGVGLAAAGTAQGLTGFSGVAMTLVMLSSLVLLIWFILAGMFMWRLGPDLARQRDAGHRRSPVTERMRQRRTSAKSQARPVTGESRASPPKRPR